MSNRAVLLGMFFSFALVGCQAETHQVQKITDTDLNTELQTNTAIDDQSLQAVHTAESLKCPSDDFESFLKSYSDSMEIQKLFTSAPLESTAIDPSAEPEPAEVTRMLDANELDFPLMPSLAKQASEGLMSRRSNLSKTNVEVVLFKPDTDYQMSFFFKQENCWKLYRIKDYSL